MAGLPEKTPPQGGVLQTGKIDLAAFLEEKHDLYNRPNFIESDPVQVPHSFTDPHDIELAAFLTATISWGQRKTIVSNALRLVSMMDHSPYEYLLYSSTKDWTRFEKFVHRTFNASDCVFFITSLQRMVKEFGGLQQVFVSAFLKTRKVEDSIREFRKEFFSIPYPEHTQKHLADIDRGSSAKRINLFLRWMVRNDGRGVDFGLWKEIPASALYVPLDVHTGNVARKLGLLSRKQNDWKAVTELTGKLREFCPQDPVKYDYALFGLGIFEKF